MTMGLQGKRLGKALTIIVLVFAALGICGFVQSSSGADNATSQYAPVGYITPSPDVLERAEQLLTRGNDVPPDVFVREIGVCDGGRDIRAERNVVGYVVDGQAQDVLNGVCNEMAQKGWVYAPTNGVVGASFSKTEGELIWAIVTCSQVGGATSVVARFG